jgi:menaquinone-dependent protoporphyrinogen oxidase
VTGRLYRVYRSEVILARILVLYASHFGQTHAIAERLARHLRKYGHEVDLADARHRPPPPQDYDLVVIGSRVEMGRHAPEVRRYITLNREALAAMPTGFFSVSMAASSPHATADPSGYMAALFDDTGWHPSWAVALAGALPYRQYGWLLRFIMKRISRSAGHTTDTSRNHVFTNWQRVRELAEDIAALVPARPAVSPTG